MSYKKPMLPCSGTITQGVHRWHKGVDIAVDVNTPLMATDDFIVHGVFARPDSGLNLVAKNDCCVYVYAHLSEVLVPVGQAVLQGDIIALSGNSGAKSKGPHLHYEWHTRQGKNMLEEHYKD